MAVKQQPIGVFDSGYGGLTVLKEIVNTLPEYDFLYLGDNARAPYGSRSFETVYEYTLQCVKALFDKGCHLVILACNTASAKALRNIQQKDLPLIDSNRRVLGVIRPTTELIGNYSTSKHVGVLGTTGTVNSGSYLVEIEKFFPELSVHQEACPMWVPIIENNEINTPGADYFFKRHVDSLLHKSSEIDAVILGCTHYPLIESQIKKYLPSHVNVLSQGPIVAKGLKDYLLRHPEIEQQCSKHGDRRFFTTEQPQNFDGPAGLFFGSRIQSEHLAL